MSLSTIIKKTWSFLFSCLLNAMCCAGIFVLGFVAHLFLAVILHKSGGNGLTFTTLEGQTIEFATIAFIFDLGFVILRFFKLIKRNVPTPSRVGISLGPGGSLTITNDITNSASTIDGDTNGATDLALLTNRDTSMIASTAHKSAVRTPAPHSEFSSSRELLVEVLTERRVVLARRYQSFDKRIRALDEGIASDGEEE